MLPERERMGGSRLRWIWSKQRCCGRYLCSGRSEAARRLLADRRQGRRRFRSLGLNKCTD